MTKKFTKIIKQGLEREKNKRLELALDKFRKKEATVWKAARIADMPLTNFFDVLKDKDILFHYSKEELEREFKRLT
jgi:predicted HTH domain antitoxin